MGEARIIEVFASQPEDPPRLRHPVSNALGTITPTRQIVRMAHRYGARVLIDGAQSVSHMATDVQSLDCDFFVFGYKTEEVGEALNREGIAVRSGHHCAQPALRRFGVETSVRPSLALYNNYDDDDTLVATLH